MRFRFSILLAGAPAMTPQQLAISEAHRWREPDGSRTDGSYIHRLINLGTNRWAFAQSLSS